jgi:diguanylate cyclase (GGDEF)-like protein
MSEASRVPLPRRAPDAAEPPAEAVAARGTPDDARFWRGHALVGLVITYFTVGLVLQYVRERPAAEERFLSAVVVAAATTSTIMFVVIRRAVRRNRHLPVFYLWSVAMVVLVLFACGVDKGASSPLTYLVFLPLLFGSLAYPWPAVLGLGVMDLVGILVVTALSPPGAAVPELLLGATAMATLMATLAAHNRGARERALRTLTQRLEELALHDGLAECLNWRGFDLALGKEVDRARRYGHPLSLLALDIDRLKEINDVGGHAAGDDAIRRVARAMERIARHSDVVGRLGGDEFAMLLPETSLDDAEAVAQRLHEALRAAHHAVPVTVSVGLAGWSGTMTSSPEALLRAADSALYAAKRAGRERTTRSGSATTSAAAASTSVA